VLPNIFGLWALGFGVFANADAKSMALFRFTFGRVAQVGLCFFLCARALGFRAVWHPQFFAFRPTWF
jgi:hypothetical protein